MKSEQRHNLQSNLLADRIGRAIENARPYLKPALLAILASIVGVIGWGVWYNLDQKSNAEAWRNYFFANGDPDQLMQVYQDSSGSAAIWAHQVEANANLANALVKIYDDRQEAEDLLNQAKKGFEAVLSKASDPLLRCRATFGLAQTLEALSEETEASKIYESLLKMPGVEPSLVSDVQARLDWMESPDGKNFFAWYKDFKPAPASSLGISPDAPISDQPDMKLPEIEPTTPNSPSNPISPGDSPNSSDSKPEASTESPATESPATESTAPQSTPNDATKPTESGTGG